MYDDVAWLSGALNEEIVCQLFADAKRARVDFHEPIVSYLLHRCVCFDRHIGF